MEHRHAALIKFVQKEHYGLEIISGIDHCLSNLEDNNSHSLEGFNVVTLRERVPKNVGSNRLIGEAPKADIVGSAEHINELIAACESVGKFNYITMSHDFADVPNPIGFLQVCTRILHPKGILSMAISSSSGDANYFQPLTQLSEWIQAFLEERTRPTFAQKFNDAVKSAFKLDVAFNEWMEALDNKEKQSHNVHCSLLMPFSFELLIRDCVYLGLISFEIIEVTKTDNNVFYAHLRPLPVKIRPPVYFYEQQRKALLHRMSNKEAQISQHLHAMEATIHALRKSTSWKITAPLRWVGNMLAKLRNLRLHSKK